MKNCPFWKQEHPSKKNTILHDAQSNKYSHHADSSLFCQSHRGDFFSSKNMTMQWTQNPEKWHSIYINFLTYVYNTYPYTLNLCSLLLYHNFINFGCTLYDVKFKFSMENFIKWERQNKSIIALALFTIDKMVYQIFIIIYTA